MNMKKAFLILIFVYLFIFIFHCSKPLAEEANPVIQNTGASGVTISWHSREPYVGKIFYKLTGTDARPSRAVEKFGETSEHEVTITGLKPATHYTYWVGETGKHYRFHTQPPVNSPFSFIAAYGEAAKNASRLLEAEVPDFFISLNTTPGDTDPFAGVRAYVPVFSYDGTATAGETGKLDWGGLRLIFLYNIESLPGLLDTPAPHTFGIMIGPGQPDVPALFPKADPALLRDTKLHKILRAHNLQNPTRPASFVWIIGSKVAPAEVDGIRYLGIPLAKDTPSGKGNAIRVDVDVESARAVLLGDNIEIALRNPPIKGKRTCHECRRLADKGAYEESIKAYKEFIENNAGHYQIDDAYFAIAEIYDEKLFLFPQAMTWYQKLLAEYPAGTLTALAGQRVKYLSQYADFDFKPLQGFDRIRKVDFSRKEGQADEQLELLTQVEGIIAQYPGSNLAPVMQHWLGNRYRQFSVDKALAAFNTLKEKYPNSAESREVSLAIGETYYNAGLHQEALTYYQAALAELPAHKKSIEALIKRSKRNIRRVVLAAFAWIALAVLLILTILLKPIGLDFSRIGFGIRVFISLGIILWFWSWLIREQFLSPLHMWLFVILFAANAGLSSFISVNFARKIPVSGVLKNIIGGLVGIKFFLAGFYLIIYYVTVHYLTIFKL